MPRRVKREIQTRDVSGGGRAVRRSTARPSKPPAKAISARQRSSHEARGEQLPKERRLPADIPMPRRSKVVGKTGANPLPQTRAGKRTPQRARAAAAADARAARPSGKAGTRESDPGIRAVPATRKTSR